MSTTASRTLLRGALTAGLAALGLLSAGAPCPAAAAPPADKPAPAAAEKPADKPAAAAKPADKAAPPAAAKPADKPAPAAAAKPADKAAPPADKPSPAAAEKPADKPSPATAAKPADKPAPPADKPAPPADKPAPAPAAKPADKPAPAAAAKPADKPAPPADKPAPAAAAKPIDKPAPATAANPIDKPAPAAAAAPPADKPAPAAAAKPADKPAPAAAAEPADKPAPIAATPPASKPAPARPPRAAAASPKGAAPPADAPIELAIPVERATLQNGLRVVMSPDKSSPTVAVAVTYDAGSRDEPNGRSGLARLVMGLMARGSRNVAAGDHQRLVAERGGELHAETLVDRTTYAETLPANELALALWLEADRMRSLDLSAQAFEAQRRDAQERRGAILGAAYGQGAIRLSELVFQGYWPHEHPALGDADDLAGAELSWVRDFHAAHYGPNRAVLAIAGGFDPGEAMELVRRYFDGIPAVSTAPFKDVPFPEQTSQRTGVVRDPAARAPAILYGWAVPPLGHPDHHALSVAAFLLGGGESSRLEALLVGDKAVARSVRVAIDGHRGPDLFSIDVRLAEGARVGDVEKLIEGEIRTLATAGPPQAELARARRQLQSAFVSGLAGASARARALAEHELLFGDASHLSGALARYFAVTREDVQRAARDHLGPTRRTIVETYPPAIPGAAPPPRAWAGAPRAAAPAAPGKGQDKATPAKGPAKTRGAAARPAAKKKPAKTAKPRKK
ncbi:M16 family metallopeptidase [Sorangium sp. So ce861]|uniref:M16 family metallopeptidase n=1 Tax=Sorangium sp. So ce861 TaxID=3133323 RepID=UPI003F6122C5